MRARASRLAERLMFGTWVTTNMSQRIGRPLVHLPPTVTFNTSQLGCALQISCNILTLAAELHRVQTNTDNQEQFTRMWTEAQPILAGYLYAVVPDFQEAEDLLQAVAVILLRKFPEYDPQRPFVGWAIGIAKREVLMARRRHARNRLFYQADLLERLADTCEELTPELEERSRALRECVRTLQGRAAELLRLRYQECLKFDVIAARVGMAAVAVRVMLSRTRAALRDCVERKLKPQNFRS
jgi:RNA polymerase sigma-70 factor, ECF subfamily